MEELKEIGQRAEKRFNEHLKEMDLIKSNEQQRHQNNLHKLEAVVSEQSTKKLKIHHLEVCMIVKHERAGPQSS